MLKIVHEHIRDMIKDSLQVLALSHVGVGSYSVSNGMRAPKGFLSRSQRIFKQKMVRSRGHLSFISRVY